MNMIEVAVKISMHCTKIGIAMQKGLAAEVCMFCLKHTFPGQRIISAELSLFAESFMILL